MTDQPEKFDLTSGDIVGEKLQELLKIFPEVRTEGGKIDFERLKAVLGAKVDVGKERYGLNWPGKADCLKTIQQPSLGTLLPCQTDSVNFDTTENLFIEGDNLEVLKLLQKSYLGKVKMIYIDPPYNTGNDFIYPDNYTETLQTFLEYTGQVDAEGKKFGTNFETDGRFHSKWLNMMYPRLYLAKNLLREDGVIFISIDDHEDDNLKKLCNDIFGEKCWIATIVWQNSSRQSDQIAIEHEYILVYGKSPSANGTKWNRSREIALRLKKIINDQKESGNSIEKTQQILAFEIDCLLEQDSHKGTKEFAWLTNYKNIDNDWNIYYPVDLSGEGSGPSRIFGGKEVPAPPGRHWMGQEYIDELNGDGRIVWRGNRAYRKLYIDESLDNLKSIIHIPTRNGSETLKQLFGQEVFDKPKPHNLIRHLAHYILESEDVVIDFFAGSGTTGHAVWEENTIEGGNRHFILVQLPEPLKPTNKEQKIAADFCDQLGKPRTIAEITKERLRRTSKKIFEQNPMFAGDLGFRVFKLAESNFKTWDAQGAHDAAELEKQLEMHIIHIRADRSPDDILSEIILKSGFSLTVPVVKLDLAGKSVFNIADGALFICLEHELTLPLIRAMAAKKPARVVCLDAGFAGNDQLKTNAVLIFKNKGVTSFKTI